MLFNIYYRSNLCTIQYTREIGRLSIFKALMRVDGNVDILKTENIDSRKLIALRGKLIPDTVNTGELITRR